MGKEHALYQSHEPPALLVFVTLHCVPHNSTSRYALSFDSTFQFAS